MIPVRSYVRLLGSYLRPYRARVAVLFGVLVAAIAVGLAIPQVLKRIIDDALSGAGSDLTSLAVAVVVLAVVLQVLRVGAAWLAEDLGWRATNVLRSELTAHVLRLDLGFHTSHSPGELIERVDGDVTALSNFFSAMIVHIGANAVLLVGIVVLMVRELLPVGLAAAGLMTASSYVIFRLHGLVSGWWRAERASNGDAAGQVGEVVEATQDIAANGARDHVMARYEDVIDTWRPRRVRAWTGWGVLWGTSEVFQLAIGLFVFVLGARRLGLAQIGSIYLLVQYADMIREPLHQLREQLSDLQKAGGAIERVSALLGTTSAMAPPGDRILPSGPLALQLDAVHFAYTDVDSLRDADSPIGGRNASEDDATTDVVTVTRVLHDVNLSLAAGRVLGVLGRTGSGKTTLARLVARLWLPDSGSVRVGGHDSNDAANLRDRVTMVSQDVQIFAASVRDNLTFFDDNVDDARLHAALTEMGLDTWLAGLPDGLDTRLGADATGLSSGQAQLLAFTRALLRDPGLVVLDEASSRLDPATETLLEHAIDAVLEGRTAIIIAHRLHTLNRADDILVMDGGRVIEFGDRRVMAADPASHYARLLATGLEEVLA